MSHNKDFEMQGIGNNLQILRPKGKKRGGLIQPNIKVNTYPGKQMGLNPTQVREYIQRMKRCKGQSFDLATGDNSDLAIQLPGTAYCMLGFVFFFDTDAGPPAVVPTGTVQMILNNEIVVDDVWIEFFGSDYTDEEYYFIPRPLSGQDDLKWNVKGVVTPYTLKLNYYYL